MCRGLVTGEYRQQSIAYTVNDERPIALLAFLSK